MGLKGTLNIEPAYARRFVGQALNLNPFKGRRYRPKLNPEP